MVPFSGSTGPAMATPIPAIALGAHQSIACLSSPSANPKSSSLPVPLAWPTLSCHRIWPSRSRTPTRIHVPPQSIATASSEACVIGPPPTQD